MNEKIIVASESSKKNTPAFISLGLAFIFFLIGCVVAGHPVDFLEGEYLVPFILMWTCIAVAIFSFIWLNSCKLVITDKRIYGKAAFGKRVNLPVDMISAVATGIFNSFSVSTSSGKITFYLLKNISEINAAVIKLLNDRQMHNQANGFGGSATDEIKKYKELLDAGIISQQEFDAKKKELLGL